MDPHVPVPAPVSGDDLRALMSRLTAIEQRLDRIESASAGEPARAVTDAGAPPAVDLAGEPRASGVTWYEEAEDVPPRPQQSSVPPPPRPTPDLTWADTTWAIAHPSSAPRPAVPVPEPSPGAAPEAGPAQREPLGLSRAPAPAPAPGRDWLALASSMGAGRLLAVIGGIALVLGAVFFLSLAFTRGWIGEEARVGLGALGGLVMLGAGALTFDRRQPTLGLVLVAAGVATLELAMYAARLYELIPAPVALLGMLVVAALATLIAVRFDSQVVAALGLLAVLVSPPLMSAPADYTTATFLAVVLVASTVVALGRGWRWLPWLSLAATAPQLLWWLGGGEESAFAVSLATLGYWLVFAIAAAGEAWLRPPLRPAGHTDGLLGAAVMVATVAAFAGLSWGPELGAWLIILAAAHVSVGAWFLLRRSSVDWHGQLLMALAFTLGTVGVWLAAPDVLVPIAWAVEAAALSWLALRLRHGYAGWGSAILLLLVAGFVTGRVYPVVDLLDQAFPPAWSSGMVTADAALVVAGLLAVAIVAGLGWLRAWPLRSPLAALALVLLAYAAPFELDGGGLLVCWCLLSLAGLMAGFRLAHPPLRRSFLPADPLIVAAATVGALALGWSVLGFAAPVGAVAIGDAAFVGRLAASLMPIAGLLVLTAWSVDWWWRGVVAGATVAATTVALFLQFASAKVVVADAVTVDGLMVLLVSWAALAVLALVLDERPRLRLASEGDLLSDPAGHPLALSALIPAVAETALLGLRFLAPGVGEPLPMTPFSDERTLATAIVVGSLILGAALARTHLVRAVLIGVAAVLVAVLLPLEVPLAWAVVGWCVMAVLAIALVRGASGVLVWGAWCLAGGLLVASAVAVLGTLGPPDRLVLESTVVPPSSGPPNEATLALLAMTLAFASAVVLAPSRRLHDGAWLAAGLAGLYLASLAVADFFALRVAAGAALEETAKQAQVALSILWAACGLATLLLGLLRDVALAQRAGVVLLLVAAAKVFLYDLAALDIAYRVLSLVGLGVLLLFSALAYQRTRHHGGPQAMGH